MSLYFSAVNIELMAVSPRYRFMHEAREASKRLNAVHPTKIGWIPVSNKLPLTPEQCCPWLKDYSPSEDLKITDDLYA